MTDERDPLTSAGCRSFNDVDTRPVLPDEVKIHGRETVDPMAEIPSHGQRLQEDLALQGHVRQDVWG